MYSQHYVNCFLAVLQFFCFFFCSLPLQFNDFSLVICSDFFLILFCVSTIGFAYGYHELGNLHQNPLVKKKEKENHTTRYTTQFPKNLFYLLCSRAQYHVASALLKKYLTQYPLDCYSRKICLQGWLIFATLDFRRVPTTITDKNGSLCLKCLYNVSYTKHPLFFSGQSRILFCEGSYVTSPQ